MIHRILYIGHWTCDFLFAEDDYDIEEVLSVLDSMNAPARVKRSLELTMLLDEDNNGFTYPSYKLHRMLVVIGPTSSGREYVDTLVHEIQHIAVVIAQDIGVDLRSETPAYIAGDAARELIEIICKFGCDRCRESHIE